MEYEVETIIVLSVSIMSIISVIFFKTGFFDFFTEKNEYRKKENTVEEEKNKKDDQCEIIEFPKVFKEKKPKEPKNKYILELTIDTKVPGLSYGLASSKMDSPFKKPADNYKIKNFISWYNRGTTPFFYFHYSNGDLSCIARDSILGFRITKRTEVVKEND